jgi:uncharacterized membrane protein
MKRFERSITINAPADKVFAYVSDFTKHGEWGGHGLAVTADDGGPVAVGSKFSSTAKQFGTQREHSTITDMNPPKEFGWDSVGALGRIHHWFSLSGEAGETTVTKGAEIAEPTFLAKMTMFKISKDMPKGFESDLANIKAKLET